MTRREAAEWLKKDTCFNCSIGCKSMAECKEDSCELKAAVLVAIAVLEEEAMEDDGKRTSAFGKVEG